MKKLLNISRLSLTLVGFLFVAVVGFNSNHVEAQNNNNLLPTTVSNVSATTNITQNFTVPSGFILSGTVTGADGSPIFGGAVTATSMTGSYAGPIAFQPPGSAAYQVVLPAGTYTLTVDRTAIDLNSGSFFNIRNTIAGMVVVNGNTTRNLTVPAAPPTVQVSGNVTSAGTLPREGFLTFQTQDGQFSSSLPFDQTYSGRLPLGTYIVTAILNVAHPEDLNQGLFLRLGTINVTAAGMFNFVLPATVTLSGKVSKSNGTAAAPALVLAQDAMVQNLLVGGNVLIPEESTTGNYRLVLPAGSYNVAAGIDIDLGQDQIGNLAFPFPLTLVNLSSNQTRNFMAPATPAVVVISGTVRTQQGQPVPGALITARSSMLTGTPNVTFSSSTETNNSGAYQLRVLSGTGYTLTADPSVPAGPSKQLNTKEQLIQRLQALINEQQ